MEFFGWGKKDPRKEAEAMNKQIDKIEKKIGSIDEKIATQREIIDNPNEWTHFKNKAEDKIERLREEDQALSQKLGKLKGNEPEW